MVVVSDDCTVMAENAAAEQVVVGPIGPTAQELGVEAEVFESRGSVGGTWTTDMSYHGLQVHSPMFTTPG